MLCLFNCSMFMLWYALLTFFTDISSREGKIILLVLAFIKPQILYKDVFQVYVYQSIVNSTVDRFWNEGAQIVHAGVVVVVY